MLGITVAKNNLKVYQLHNPLWNQTGYLQLCINIKINVF